MLLHDAFVRLRSSAVSAGQQESQNILLVECLRDGTQQAGHWLNLFSIWHEQAGSEAPSY